MQLRKRLLVLGLGVLVLTLLAAGPSLAHRNPRGNGRHHPGAHGCGRGIPGQTNPPHRTHSHTHGGQHHTPRPPNEHQQRHRHLHNHPCPYPPGKPRSQRVASNFSGFEQPRDQDPVGVTVGMLILAGMGAFTVFIAARTVRRRIIR